MTERSSSETLENFGGFRPPSYCLRRPHLCANQPVSRVHLGESAAVMRQFMHWAPPRDRLGAELELAQARRKGRARNEPTRIEARHVLILGASSDRFALAQEPVRGPARHVGLVDDQSMKPEFWMLQDRPPAQPRIRAANDDVVVPQRVVEAPLLELFAVVVGAVIHEHAQARRPLRDLVVPLPDQRNWTGYHGRLDRERLGAARQRRRLRPRGIIGVRHVAVIVTRPVFGDRGTAPVRTHVVLVRRDLPFGLSGLFRVVLTDRFVRAPDSGDEGVPPLQRPPLGVRR